MYTSSRYLLSAMPAGSLRGIPCLKGVVMVAPGLPSTLMVILACFMRLVAWLSSATSTNRPILPPVPVAFTMARSNGWMIVDLGGATISIGLHLT
ncbi:MAG: hypothetical protein QXS00_01085 [Pyrobaculum sp.]